MMVTKIVEERSLAEVWLGSFPAQQHTTVAAWFRHAIRRGAQSPDAVLIKVTALVGQKLDWAVEPASRQLCTTALQALRCNRPGALAYAASLLLDAARERPTSVEQ